MDSHHFGRSGRNEEHVPFTQQLLGAHLVQDSAGINFLGYAKGDARREVGLNNSGNDIDGGSLSGHDQVDAHGASHLGEPHDGIFNILGSHHHQIRQFVNDDDDKGERLLFGIFFFREQFQIFRFFHQGIILLDVPNPDGGQQLIATFHFIGGPLQGIGGAFRFGDNRRQQVGN